MAGDEIQVSFEVTLTNGEVLTCESQINVLDSISPTILCPNDTLLFLNENCEVEIPDFEGEFILNSGCEDSLAIEVVQIPVAGEIIPSFSGEEITVTLIATNPLNNTVDSCEFIIETQDSIPPSLECSGDTVIIELDADCSAEVPDISTEIVSLSDNCTEEQDVVVSQNPSIGTEVNFPENPLDVELTATDQNGNTSTCIVILDFIDTTPPNLTCPPDTVVSCQFDIDSTEQYGNPTAFDNCSSVSISFVNQYFSQNSCTIDSLKRTFTAVDDSGNESTCVQTIIFEGSNPDLDSSDFIFVDTVFTQDCEMTEPEDIPGSIPMLNPDLDVCKVITSTFEDGPTRTSDFGCLEFDREWTLVDSCANNAMPGDGVFIFDQLVVINDTVSPQIDLPFLDTIIYIDSCGTAVEIEFSAATASDCTGIDTIFNDSPFADDNGSGDISGTYEEGVYDISITAIDSCGNETTEVILLSVSDTSDLEFSCTFKVEKPFDTTTMMVPYFISEMVEGLVNSCGNVPAGVIEFSVDPTDPTDTVIIVTCEDFGPMGTEFVEEVPVYAFIDGELVDSCITIIAITDNVIGCMIEAIMGGVVDVNQEPFDKVDVSLTGSDTAWSRTNIDGDYGFMDVPGYGYYHVNCTFDGSPYAGVSTLDLLLIQQHILGLKLLESPYAQIAADVDKNKRITGNDIIMLRRLILNIDTEMPVDNWRFIPESYEFINPDRAYAENYPESIQIESLYESILDADFIGVKVGDVNGSISPDARGRSGREIWSAEKTNENVVHFYAEESEALYGFQFEIPAQNWGDVVILDGQIQIQDYQVSFTKGGDFLVSWSDPYGRKVNATQPLFSIQSDKVSDWSNFELSSESLAPEVYSGEGSGVNTLKLHWIEGIQNYALHQNRPNPFVESTIVPFELPFAEVVEFTVYDNTGRIILQEKIQGKRGYNEWKLRSTLLQQSGSYYYTMKADKFLGSKTLIVVDP
jgi:hypothetical protein